MNGIRGSRLLWVAGCAVALTLVGCSRSSLLGGPGPEEAHHASPAEIERLAVFEPGKKFDTKEECHRRLLTLAHASSPDQLIKISQAEVRAYHSTGEGSAAVHHEYSCLDKQLMARSWTGKAAHASVKHHADDTAPEQH